MANEDPLSGIVVVYLYILIYEALVMESEGAVLISGSLVIGFD